MKRYITINGVEFEQVKEIPCRTDLKGRRLEDVYSHCSIRKKSAFNSWDKWARGILNLGFSDQQLVITDMWISSHTANFFTLVFKWSYIPEYDCSRVDFIACATGRHNYIKFIDERMD